MGKGKNTTPIGFKPKVYTIEKAPSLPVREFREKGKLIIGDKLQQQIDYLHDKISTEWSGILLYTHKTGEIHEPESSGIHSRKRRFSGDSKEKSGRGGWDTIDRAYDQSLARIQMD